jgi:putative phosphoribosyl transferase
MFKNRQEAGRELAVHLRHYQDDQPVVLALPRGGVPVGFEVATALGAPLDVIVVRKLGAPGQPELAIGAVVDGEHPETVLNDDMIALLDVSPEYLATEVACQLEEIHRRQRRYRRGRARAEVAGRTAIVVDDGVATGASMRAALRGVRRAQPKRLVLAVPVAPADTIEALRGEVDDLVCLSTPSVFVAVGLHYEEFGQTTDGEVVALLARAQRPRPPQAP